MIEKILEDDNVSLAITHLLSKKDSCGIDGLMLSQLNDYYKLNKDELCASIYNGTFKPNLVKNIEIIGRNGKVRTISKLCSFDRLLLRAIYQVLYRQTAPNFSKNSFAFQEQKGTLDAVTTIKSYINDGYKYVAEIDILNFFDNISHELLIQKLSSAIQDNVLLNLIKAFLTVEVENDYEISKKNVGLVQGSPLSPLLSNIFLNSLDKFIESNNIAYIRFADDIKLFSKDYNECISYFNLVKEFIKTECKLDINSKKSGVFSVLTGKYFGYELINNNEQYEMKKISRSTKSQYKYWNTTSIRKDSHHYHLISDGVLNRKDFSILFENEDNQMYIPVEVVDSLCIHSNIIMSSDFLKFANKKSLIISFFDTNGNFVGNFYPQSQRRSVKVTIKQAVLYSDERKRLEIAKIIIIASMHNINANLKYYNKKHHIDEIKTKGKNISEIISNMNEAKTIQNLMLLEAKGREIYFSCYNSILNNNENFKYIKRTRRPPKDALNAMISFGNVVLYNYIANEIYKTPLDIEISFLHSANKHHQGLNLDIAEIFKPILIDRIIFTLVNKHMINEELHFEHKNDGGVYLNKIGKKIFLNEIEKKFSQRITVNEKSITYRQLIKDELSKLLKAIVNDQKYKPYRYR